MRNFEYLTNFQYVKNFRSIYLKWQDSYYMARINESNPWIAVDLGTIWTINRVSIVRKIEPADVTIFQVCIEKDFPDKIFTSQLVITNHAYEVKAKKY